MTVHFLVKLILMSNLFLNMTVKFQSLDLL